MATQHVIRGFDAGTALPHVRHIGLADLKAALANGYDDFRAMPSHLFYLGLIYPIVGLILAKLTFGYHVMPLLFPLVAGFALVGPAAGTFLYELSRRRERGEEVSWGHAFSVLKQPGNRSIVALTTIVFGFFIAWMYTAQALYIALFGDMMPVSFSQFADQVLSTSSGWTLIVVGNLIGFFYAAAVLVLTVISFPMLIDRPVGTAVAVQTSIRAVMENPGTMAMWGLIVAVALVLGSIPCLIGLALVVPILGHATWHLYRRTVEW